MERASLFNNVGADLLENGEPSTAWAMFKGALEVRLASEKLGLVLTSKDSEHYRKLMSENPHVSQAEQIFGEVETRLASSEDNRGNTTSVGP